MKDKNYKRLNALLGSNIRDARLDCEMTQETLAEAIYVVNQTVSKWELGKCAPDIENLAAIHKALGVPLWSLLPTEEELWGGVTKDNGTAQHQQQEEHRYGAQGGN